MRTHGAQEEHSLFKKLKLFQNVFLPELQHFLSKQQKDSQLIDSFAKEMLDKLHEYMLRGGKKIRPALLYYNYQGDIEANSSIILPIAIACELMQSFFLILDDIMDESELRRGDATMHRLYHIGGFNSRTSESFALLVGNITGYLGIEVIANSNIPPEYKCTILSLYAKTCINVGYGQALDIYPFNLKTLSETNIYKIYHYKTSCYTTEFPLLCAAVLANSELLTQDNLKTIASHIGILFQIRDDILGLLSDPNLIGKSVVSDAQQGKKTLLIYKTWEKASKNERKMLSKIYGKLDITLEEISIIKDLVITTGALEDVYKTMQFRSEETFKLLDNLNWSYEGKEFIRNLVDYCIASGYNEASIQPTKKELNTNANC